MAHFTANFEGNKCIVYNHDTVLGVIEFENNTRVVASIILDDTIFKTHQASATDKDIVITTNDAVLLKFKFDYLWGGATLFMGGEPTGYKVTGKAFKPGSRLVNSEGHDMVVVKNASNWSEKQGLDIEVIDSQVTNFLIMATVYYHIYTSAAKLYSMVGIV